MSYTAIYSPLYPLDCDPEDMSWRGDAFEAGVKILDPDGLDEHVPDWDTDMVTDTYTDRSGYPASQWTVLKGFQTWDRDECNIERLGFYYDRMEAVDFWSGLSEYTEPFQFFTSPFDGGWLHALDIVTVDREETGAMHVVCHSGDCWMHEIPVTNGGRQPVER